MASENLTNSQFFQKYRFERRKPSDSHVATHGHLVESCKPPDKFYNGWYPIRQCSFPQHKPPRPAGLDSVRDGTAFRHYRVHCGVCDSPENQPPSEKKEPYCGFPQCKLNSVAPKPPQKPCSTPQDVSGEQTPRSCTGKGDRYWRYHDPYPWDPSNKLPSDCKAHKSNWFRHQMDCENIQKQRIKPQLLFEKDTKRRSTEPKNRKVTETWKASWETCEKKNLAMKNQYQQVSASELEPRPVQDTAEPVTVVDETELVAASIPEE